MHQIKTSIGSTPIIFKSHANGILFETEFDSLLFPNMTAASAEEQLRKNYDVVYTHYKKKADNKLSETDLQQACFKLVVFYFYMYAFWKAYNPNQADRDLDFAIADFDHPYTFDKIREFFMGRDGEHYAEKAAAFLSMNLSEFKAYEQQRQDFFNMW